MSEQTQPQLPGASPAVQYAGWFRRQGCLEDLGIGILTACLVTSHWNQGMLASGF